MCQGLGQHVRAVQLLTEALEDAATPDATIECLFMRGAKRGAAPRTPEVDPEDRKPLGYHIVLRAGACRHALGHMLEAIGNERRTVCCLPRTWGEDARTRGYS